MLNIILGTFVIIDSFNPYHFFRGGIITVIRKEESKPQKC